MSTEEISMGMHEEAVAHARRAGQAAYLGWRHLQSEYSQDVDTVLATIETHGPWTWTLPLNGMASAPTDDGEAGPSGAADNGAGPGPANSLLQYVSATNMAEIREQYESMRTIVEVWDWISMTDLRTGWYMLTHGVANLKDVALGTYFQLESVTLFPIGHDGILGEVQIGDFANQRPNRWPETPSSPGEIPLPIKRLQATMLHNEFMEALKSEDVPRLLGTMRPDVATAIRSYLSDDYTVINAEGSEALGQYYRSLFSRFRVKDVRLLNRVVESWYVFAELHWTVEHRDGPRAGEVVEFCTADIAPIDAEGKFWVRTGAGTDPVSQPVPAGHPAPFVDERGPGRGWEIPLATF
jgi:hypothetical protein